MATEANIVVATLTIDFTDDSGDNQGTLMLEELGEDEGGEKGDYVMYKGNIELLEHNVIGGSKSANGPFTKEVEEYVTFSNSTTASLPYPVDSGLTLIPVGQAYKIDKKTGVVSQVSHETLGKPSLQADLVTIEIGMNAVALFKATYTATGERFKVTTALPVVMVFAVGRVK